MAIVENKSTEIGDVIRITTNVPVVGVISLYSFIDDTVGEIEGGNGTNSNLIPSFSTPAGKIDNFLNHLIHQGQYAYGIVRASDGSFNTRSIARYDYNSMAWDFAWPDASHNIGMGIVFYNNKIYGVGTTFFNTMDYISVSSLDLSSRTWTLLSDKGYLIDPRNTGRILNKQPYDNKLWMQAANRVISFDPGTNTFNQSVANGDRLNYIAIDQNNGHAYMNLTATATSNQNRLQDYNITTTTWQSLTAANTRDIYIITYNTADNLIYGLQKDLVDPTKNYQIVTYNPATNTWNDNFPESPVKQLQDISTRGPYIYVINNLFEIYTFDTSTNQWLDETVPTRYFNKKFRYSVDGGLNFTPFMDLTLINIQSVDIKQKDLFVLDFSYEREGSDSTGELQWNSLTLSGTIYTLSYPVYDQTIFKKYFEVNDVNVLGWAINVLEKLYHTGILPTYIIRNQGGKEDLDFVSYWNSVTHIFAIFVYLARNFENITNNKDILVDYLKNFDMTIPFDENLGDLGYIFANREKEYRIRGTNEINRVKGIDGAIVDGEMLRLINKQLTDFYLWGLIEAEKFGWCIGESSPTWTGTENMKNLVIAYEPNKAVENLAKYPLLNPGSISIENDATISTDVMKFSSVAADTGIGFADVDNPNRDFLIVVDPGIDYEISFKVKKELADQDFLRFYAYGYDENFNKIELLPIDNTVLFASNFYGDSSNTKLLLNDEYYWIRGVLFNKDEPYSADKKLNFKGGRGLRLTADVKYIGFLIYVTGDFAGGNLYIYDIKMRPLDLPISQALFGIKNIIISYIKNNGELDDGMTDNPGPNDPIYEEPNDALRKFIQDKLIPYNSFIIPRYL